MRRIEKAERIGQILDERGDLHFAGRIKNMIKLIIALALLLRWMSLEHGVLLAISLVGGTLLGLTRKQIAQRFDPPRRGALSAEVTFLLRRDGSVFLNEVPWGPLQRVARWITARSVAEVSALTKMPIGVTRVLLGDLIEQGLVRIQATINDSTSTDERLELIERTLRGLRNY